MPEGFLLDEKFAEELAALIRHVRKNGLWDARQSLVTDSLLFRTILVKNTSAFEIPPWGCMEVEGIANEDGQAYVKVKRPTAAVGSVSYLFNSDRAIEASTGNPYGVAQRGPIVRMLTDGSSVTIHATWQPSIGTFEVKPGGFPFIAIGTDDVDTDVMKGMFNTPALIHVKTKAACAARNDATGAMASVSCDRYITATDGTQTDAGYDIDVFNPGGPVGSGKWGTVLINEAGQYEFVVVKCS